MSEAALDLEKKAESKDDYWETVPCHMCTNQCGIRVHIENGKLVETEGWDEHPRSQGKLCVRARHMAEYVNHEKRLQHPMVRDGEGWRRISWDEALDTIATKLREAKEKYGPASTGAFLGEPACMTEDTSWYMAWRFCDAFGTPTRFDPTDLCGVSTWTAQIATFGYMVEPDMENTQCSVIWATNPHASDHTAANHVLEAKKKGGKLIVINPREIPLAKKADLHIKPLPGTDGMLALAMINLIIEEELYDKEFVANYTHGFDKLAEHVKPYTVAKAAEVTGVPEEEIRTLTRMYATAESAAIRTYFRLSFVAPDGFQNYRALSILCALTGNVDKPGGELQFGNAQGAQPKRSVRMKEMMKGVPCVGAEEYPVYGKLLSFYKEGGMVNFSDLILDEPKRLRNLIIVGSNPVVTWPNTQRVRKALSELDFLVVMDLIPTPTTEMADMVLPAAASLEKPNYFKYHGHFMIKRLVEPLGEAKTECMFWTELARKLDLGEYFPWNSDEEAFDYFYDEPGFIENRFEEHPTGFLSYNIDPGQRLYRENGFPTPSGKVELYSDMLEEMGQPPMPVYRGTFENPQNTPEVFAEYPLHLDTGYREVQWWHSMYRHVEKLLHRNPYPEAYVHTDTAEKYGISNGDWMVIETRRGSIEIRAKVDTKIIPNVISVPHGWAESNYNNLTDDKNLDPVTGFPAFTGLLCRIRPRDAA